MRESNHNFPPQNRAAVVISNALYDRRAFDSPISTLPLLSSLTHLSYLTSTSPRIREILTVDGGLERLVYIATACIELAHNPSPSGSSVKRCTCAAIDGSHGMTIDPSTSSSTATASRTCACLLRRPRGPRFKAFSAYSKRAQGTLSATEARVLLMTYTLSLQSLVNVGVRGSEHIRTRVVQAGVLALSVQVLRGFLAERTKQAAEAPVVNANALPMPSIMTLVAPSALPSPTGDSPDSDGEILPPVTRTPTPDAVTLVADEGYSASAVEEEERRQDAQDAQDDAEMESSASRTARARSATIKSGPSPPTEIVNDVLDMGGEDDAMDVDDASPPESGESDADEDAMVMPDDELQRAATPLSATFPPPQPSGMDEATPRAPVLQLPHAVFEGSPASPHVHLVSPTPSTSSTTSAGALAFRFREDDVLLCLQLLAYLSKYPHVRSVFHEPDRAYDCAPFPRNADGSPAVQPASAPPADPSKNVFSLVEKFTVRPSPNDRAQPRMPGEIQYWAGVIMRNACRKDESRGGIRQCANMACGTWEKFPREFAKCRRCRKAKYCSKPCQSKAWQGGHRYWCSARDPSDHHHGHGSGNASNATADGTAAAAGAPAAGNAAALARARELVDLLDDDDDALNDGVPARPPQPRTHILLRHTTLPETFANPTATVTVTGGIGVTTDDDVVAVNAGTGVGVDVEDAENVGARFF